MGLHNLQKHNFFYYRYDYLVISNHEKGEFGKYCGARSGKEILVIGDYALLTFHSDSDIHASGFIILFTFLGK